jgi:LPXTG-motif cell wall-anchored protein
VLLAFAFVPAAWAHSFIDHCTPDGGASLQQAPAQITCVFTEAIDAKQTRFTVADANNNRVDNNDVKADPNDNKGLTVIVTLNAAKITGGQYTVKWTTVSADGDATDGQWQFAVNAQPAPSITLVSPTMDSIFDKDPSDVVVTVNVTNFALGQAGRRWQIYLDSNLVAQVTDGSTTTTLKAVKKGDYAMKVALATDDKTVVATAGTHLGIAIAAMTPAQPAQPTTTAPSTLPKTGSDTAAWPAAGIALVMLLLGCVSIGLGRGVRRRG